MSSSKKPSFKPRARPKPTAIKEEIVQPVDVVNPSSEQTHATRRANKEHKQTSHSRTRHTSQSSNRSRNTATTTDALRPTLQANDDEDTAAMVTPNASNVAGSQTTKKNDKSTKTNHQMEHSLHVTENITDEKHSWDHVNVLHNEKADALESVHLPFIPESISRIDPDAKRLLIPTEEQLPQWGHLDNQEDRRHVLLFQWPTRLPLTVQAETPPPPAEVSPVKTEVMDTAPAPAPVEPLTNKPENRLPNPFADVKSGNIGKLVVHASGKAYIYLGETKFEVLPDLNSSFHEEFVQIKPTDQEGSMSLTPIATCAGRMIVKPDVRDLLASTRAHDMHQYS